MSQENNALIRRLMEECFNQHNADRYYDFYSPNFRHRTGSLGELGAEGHRQVILSIFAAFPDAHWTIVDQIEQGDRAVMRWSLVATHVGTFMGIAATGRGIVSGGICIYRICDGKILEEWEEWDTLGMMQQLGAVPSVKTEPVVAA
jgi:steroid delta-isomerase-like uncharacterized protein